MTIEKDESGLVIAHETTLCLTSGIRKVFLREDEPKRGQTVSWTSEDRGNYIRTGRIGGTVFLSFADACREAERFKQQRIKKLREQIEKLESLTYTEDKNA